MKRRPVVEEDAEEEEKEDDDDDEVRAVEELDGIHYGRHCGACRSFFFLSLRTDRFNDSPALFFFFFIHEQRRLIRPDGAQRSSIPSKTQ